MKPLREFKGIDRVREGLVAWLDGCLEFGWCFSVWWLGWFSVIGMVVESVIDEGTF